MQKRRSIKRPNDKNNKKVIYHEQKIKKILTTTKILHLHMKAQVELQIYTEMHGIVTIFRNEEYKENNSLLLFCFIIMKASIVERLESSQVTNKF